MTKSKKREIDKTKKNTLYQHEIVGASDPVKIKILKVPVLQSLESLKKLAVIRKANPGNNNSLTDLIQEKDPVAETRAEDSAMAKDGTMTNNQENAMGIKNFDLGQKISTPTLAAKRTDTKNFAPATKKNHKKTRGAAAKKIGVKGELQNTLDNFVLNTPSSRARINNKESPAAEEVEASKTKRVEVFRNDISASSANVHQPEDNIKDALRRKILEIEAKFNSNIQAYKLNQDAQICQLEASNDRLKSDAEKLKVELYNLKEKHGAESAKFQETLEEEKKIKESTSARLERLQELVRPLKKKLVEFKDENDNLMEVNKSLKNKVEKFTLASHLSEEKIQNLESEVVMWKTKYEKNAKDFGTFKDASALEGRKAVEEIENEVVSLKNENSMLKEKLDDERKERKNEASRLTVDFKKIKDKNELLTQQLIDQTEKMKEFDREDLSQQLRDQSKKFQDEKKWLQSTLRQQEEEIEKLKKVVAAKETVIKKPSSTLATSSKRKRSASSENPAKKNKVEESKQLHVSFSSSSTAEDNSIDDLLEDSLEIDTTAAESTNADSNEETDQEDAEAAAAMTKAPQPCSNLLANIEKFTASLASSTRGGEVAPDLPSIRRQSVPSKTPVASSPITRKVTNPENPGVEEIERQVSKPIGSTTLQLQRKKRLADLFGDDEDDDAAGLSSMPEVGSPDLGKAGETLLIEETDPPLNVSYSPAKTSQVEQPHVTQEKRCIKVRDLQEVLGSNSATEKSESLSTNFEEEVDLAAIAKHAGKLDADVTDVVKRCLKRFSQSGNETLSSEQFEHLAREFSQDFSNVITTKYLEVHENLLGIEIKNEDKTSIIDNIIFFFAVKDAVRKHTTAEAAGRKNLRITPQKFIQELTKEFYIKIRDGSTAYKEAGGSLNLTDDLQQQILNNIRFKIDMLNKK